MPTEIEPNRNKLKRDRQSWHKLPFAVFSEEQLSLALVITQTAGEIARREGPPKGFAVFSQVELGENIEDARVALILSPVASSLCLNAFPEKALIPCEKPSADDERLGILFGPTSWDLLE
jgi:hypothetical protein